MKKLLVLTVAMVLMFCMTSFAATTGPDVEVPARMDMALVADILVISVHSIEVFHVVGLAAPEGTLYCTYTNDMIDIGPSFIMESAGKYMINKNGPNGQVVTTTDNQVGGAGIHGFV